MGIDQTRPSVSAEVLFDRNLATAADFLPHLPTAFALPSYVIVTDNGFKWLDRATDYGRRCSPPGRPGERNRLCRAHNVEQRTFPFASCKPTAWKNGPIGA